MKKKIALIVAIIVVLLIAAGAYAYLGTDLFKSGKEMFFSYLEKDLDKQNEVSKYMAKKQKTPQTNNGTVRLSITGLENEKEVSDVINSSKISFNGSIDPAKMNFEENISAEAQGVSIPVSVKKVGETIGLQSGLIDPKYIAIKNENLDKLVEKFLPNTLKGVPEKIDFTEYKLTEAEIKELSQRYKTILLNNLEEKMFEKGKADNQTVITLTIDNAKAAKIVDEMLAAFKEDNIVMSRIEKFVKTLNDMGVEDASVESIKTSIDELINKIKEEENKENGLKIVVKEYIANKELAKIEVEMFSEESKILSLEATEKEGNIKIYDTDGKLIENLKYTIKLDEQNYVCNIEGTVSDEETTVEIRESVEYKNIKSDNVEEIYNVTYKIPNTGSFESLDSPIDLSIVLNNTISFKDSVTINEFNANDAIVVNDATDEELQQLILNIYQKFGSIANAQ